MFMYIFSELLEDDLEKRLLISVWHKDETKGYVYLTKPDVRRPTQTYSECTPNNQLVQIHMVTGTALLRYRIFRTND